MFRSPSHSTVVAYCALFVALGGTSVAAVTLGKDVVTSKSIKNGQVKNADLGADAVTAAKVKDGSLTKADFGAGQLPVGATGPAGPAGPAGSAGAKGDTGATGATAGAGAKGDKGDTGNTGASGSSLAVQMTCSNCPVNQTGAGTSPLTFTSNPFTPPANQAAQVYVRVGWNPPPTSGTCTGGGSGGQVDIQLDGASLTSAQALNGAGAQVTSAQAHVFASATPTAHTVTVTVSHNCGGTDVATASDARADVVTFTP